MIFWCIFLHDWLIPRLKFGKKGHYFYFPCSRNNENDENFISESLICWKSLEMIRVSNRVGVTRGKYESLTHKTTLNVNIIYFKQLLTSLECLRRFLLWWCDWVVLNVWVLFWCWTVVVVVAATAMVQRELQTK